MTIPRILASTDTDQRTPIADRRIPATRDEMTTEDREAAMALVSLMRVCDEIRDSRRQAPRQNEKAA